MIGVEQKESILMHRNVHIFFRQGIYNGLNIFIWHSNEQFEFSEISWG